MWLERTVNKADGEMAHFGQLLLLRRRKGPFVRKGFNRSELSSKSRDATFFYIFNRQTPTRKNFQDKMHRYNIYAKVVQIICCNITKNKVWIVLNKYVKKLTSFHQRPMFSDFAWLDWRGTQSSPPSFFLPRPHTLWFLRLSSSASLDLRSSSSSLYLRLSSSSSSLYLKPS